MTSSLKRKRVVGSTSRKTRKVEEEVGIVGSPAGELDVGNEGMVDQEDAQENQDMDGEDEWGGVADCEPMDIEEGDETRSGTKPKKPPTGEELRVIRDAADLFRSSSFKLQIDALLPNVRPKSSRIPPLERFLLKLHTFIMNIPSVSPQHPLEAARKLMKKAISVPYSLPLPTEETNWKVAYEQPTDITLVGSWGNKISVKPKDGLKFSVDVAVEMPNSLFQEKDYLNGRFFHKRAFYLASLAAAIQKSKSGLNVDLHYDSKDGDPRLTKLVLTPKNDDSQDDFTKLNAQIFLIPSLSPSSPIPLHRLSPAHGNLRVTTSDSSNDDSKLSNESTPIYNTALLLTMTPKPTLLKTHTIKQDAPAFADAVTLLRVWANQRGYSEGTRMCVHGFEGRGSWWSALIASLIIGEERIEGEKASKTRPLGRGLSSYQLFKAALDFLAKHDFEKKQVFVRTTEKHRFPPEEYRAHHNAVFVDSSSCVNLLAGVPLGSLELLRYDAVKTLEILNQTKITGDPFTDVFLKEQRDLPIWFDTVLRVDLTSAKLRKSSLLSTMDLGSLNNLLIASLSALIRRGLGDRSKAVAILHPSSSSRPLSQAHPSNLDVVYIGIVHNVHHAFRLVDHGPAADEKDESIIAEFRELWGDKAELRRFKDGSIVESVVWDVKTADERSRIPTMVVQHILKRHFSIDEGSVQTWQSSFDSVLRLPESISSLYLASKIPTGFKGAITAFDNLVKSIKALDEKLPLSLLNVSASSEFLRYTSVFSPIPLPSSLATVLPPNARYLAPIDIVLKFEKSSKWPDDLKAIQKIKLAFFEHIATALMESVDGLKASVVVGDGVHSSDILDQACLEIVTPEGWAFSARIWHDREATLLDRIIGGAAKALPHIVQKKESKPGKEHQEAIKAKEVYTRRFIHAPRHHRAIAAISHHYSAYPGTVRLVKRWLASHWLLGGHVSEEAVEIVCASIFIGDGHNISTDPDTEKIASLPLPGSKERGFASVVQFLKEWKWEEAIFVPIYGSASGLSDAEKVKTKASNDGVWTLSTEHDPEGRMWTAHGPDLVVARRIRVLAEATWKYMQAMEDGSLNVQSLFIHPSNDYDFIVQLDPTVLPQYFHNIAVDGSILAKHGKYANQTSEDQNSAVLTGFDPAQLLFEDLKRIYTDTFKIFHDPLGGDRFGVVWDPALKQPRPFRVLGGFSSIPIKKENEKEKDKGLVVLNEKAVINEVERLGSGIVKAITIHV